MKISLALGPRRPLSRQTAWGCFTTNVSLPGAGSLVAGRVSGYAQLALAVGGLTMSAMFGLRFFFWLVANWRHLHDPQLDGMTALLEMWRALRLPLLAMGIFLAGWLWALLTSLSVLHEAKKHEPMNVPPRLS